MLRVLVVVAHLADVAQLSLQVLKGVDLLGDPEDLQIQEGEHRAAVGVRLAPAAEQHPDLRERHPERATVTDEHQARGILGRIEPVIAAAALRPWQQPLTLIEATGFDLAGSPFRQLADFYVAPPCILQALLTLKLVQGVA